MINLIRTLYFDYRRMQRLRKRLLIAYEALEKLSYPLCSEWYVDIAKKALEDMKEIR